MKKTCFALLFALLLIFTLGGCRKKCTHIWQEATCTSPKTCQICQATEGAPLSHIYFETVVTEATCQQDGVKRFTCQNCNDSYDESFPYPKYDASEIYEMAKNSVGEIITYNKSGTELSLGSCFVYSADGKMVTNYHVIEYAHSAKITINNQTYPVTQILAYDKEIDLAVLKIDAQDLVPAEFGDSSLLRVGDSVSALGSPLGYRMTLTSGIVSAMDRELEIDGESMYLLQTDAAINFGNSGGALFNDRGQVVGVTTAKIVATDGSSEALGFAIPSDRVKYVVDLLIEGEEIRTPALGITVQYAPDVVGLTVIEIMPWSDAVAQGIQLGDVITAVAGREVRTNRDLQREKNLHRVGEQLRLDVVRGEEELVFYVLLQDWEEQSVA